ncbi:HEAT repeat domain-containing protein [Streptomyces sp. NBC_00162]|uniref:HEAT repeat domain-containing protein n=1 Tax=Streptomyces sp. NBC_00162 TaxID=2903629 RepID=UPI00214C0F50|nr:HEAT repeat domain-containing protein [Streptomyces sp. NBC_00162]UUU40204.1 HEAT repeat domain-containing protein [Streptomyces sp. NBC_00162]
MGDPRCGPALIGLLGGDNPTVREWAAIALASLEIDDAVEPLRRAYRACLERATSREWTEPDGIRWALTELGARSPVVPSLTARLRTDTGSDSPGWPSAHFTAIINDLAAIPRPAIGALRHWPACMRPPGPWPTPVARS